MSELRVLYPRCCPSCRQVLTRLKGMEPWVRWCRRCAQVVQYPGVRWERFLAEEAVREADYLARGLCPHSGERLTCEVDAWGRLSAMCPLCDCFGFDPEDPRLKVDKRGQ